MKLPPFVWLAIPALLGLAGCATTPELGSRSEQDMAEARQVRAVLNRWIEAGGGAPRIGSIKAMESRAILEFADGDKKMEVTQRKWIAADGRYRIETETAAGGVGVEAYDGKVAWRKHDRLGVGFLTPQELNRTLYFEDLRHMLKIELKYPARRLLSDAVVSGRPCHVLAMSGRVDTVEKWFFDAASGELVRCEELTLPLRNVTASVEFSDPRNVNGLVLPFVEHHTAGGSVFVIRRQSVTVDPPLDAVNFSPSEKELHEAREAERILAGNLAALGKAEVILGLRSRVTASNVNVTSSGLKYRMKVSQKQPNLVLNEQEIPGVGRVVQGFDGTTAWVNSEVQGYRTLKGIELQQAIAGGDLRADAQLRWRCPLWRLLEDATVNGRRARGLALATLQGPAGNYYFDAENGRLLRVEANVLAGADGFMAVTMEFSDFRTVDGITMPFVTTMNNPAMQSVTTVESVKTNVPLDDEIFKPRKDE
jgi:hypothetical protein